VTTLFAKAYLDENVDIRRAALLRHRGFSATTVHAVGLLRADDQTQLSYAATNGYCLVTHNLRELEVLHDSFLSAGRSQVISQISILRGKIRQSTLGNSMTYRHQNSRKSNFATEPALLGRERLLGKISTKSSADLQAWGSLAAYICHIVDGQGKAIMA
jgi:predicted nuclease of predicted toxin-antitoxin system